MAEYPELALEKGSKHRVTLLLLIAAAMVGNYFSIAIYPGMDFWLGSVATLVAVSLFGTVWGAFVALMSVWYIVLGVGQPALALIYLGEAIAVGTYLRWRRGTNILVADSLFWGYIGIPLALVLNIFLLHMDLRVSLMMAMKWSVDGLFNALLATQVVTNLPVRRWAGLQQEAVKSSISLEHTLFNLMVTFILLPVFLFTSLDIRNDQQSITDEITSRLHTVSRQIQYQISQLRLLRENGLGSAAARTQLSGFLAAGNQSGKVHIVVTDSKGQIVAASEPGSLPVPWGEGSTTSAGAGILRWMPQQGHYFTKWGQGAQNQRWEQSIYFTDIKLPGNEGWTANLAVPVEHYSAEFQQRAMVDLAWVLLLTLLALLAARLITAKLAGPLVSLSQVTSDLPENLSRLEPSNWPESWVWEINTLINNSRQMAEALKENFSQLQAATDQAEEERRKSEGVVACIGDGLGIINADFEIVFQNNRLQEILGPATGCKCYEVYTGKDYVCRGCPVAKSLSDGQVHRGEFIARTKRGELPIEITASPLKDSGGRIIGGIELVRDISERHLIEKALREQQEKLEAQLKYSQALTHVAEVIIISEDTEVILETMCSRKILSTKANGIPM
ncbi:MAG TPA: PAS domain-containing protein [Bacillota bacterium]|nr:PAS domain-containing protein [Bacillota bacterium]